MRPRHLTMVALAVLLTAGSAVAQATEAPNLTTFCYWYNSAWRCANNISEYVYSCDDGDTTCYFVADYCEGDNPDVGTAFEMWFDFSSSKTFVSGEMWDTDEHLNEVYDHRSKVGSTWYLYSATGIDIEWDLETGVAWVGRFKVSLPGLTYTTYVYARRVVCK